MEYRRDLTPGASYFFTVVTADRKPILIDQIARLRYAFRNTMEKYPFTVEAIVILPDHLHTIWTLPDGERDYPLRWQVLKRLFSSSMAPASRTGSKIAKREKGIWQRRFWEHRVRNEADWRHHVDYIHFNPVKHGYASSPSQWAHSSFHRFVKHGLLPPDWGKTEPKIPDLQAGE